MVSVACRALVCLTAEPSVASSNTNRNITDQRVSQGRHTHRTPWCALWQHTPAAQSFPHEQKRRSNLSACQRRPPHRAPPCHASWTPRRLRPTAARRNCKHEFKRTCVLCHSTNARRWFEGLMHPLTLWHLRHRSWYNAEGTKHQRQRACSCCIRAARRHTLPAAARRPACSEGTVRCFDTSGMVLVAQTVIGTRSACSLVSIHHAARTWPAQRGAAGRACRGVFPVHASAGPRDRSRAGDASATRPRWVPVTPPRLERLVPISRLQRARRPRPRPRTAHDISKKSTC